MKKALNHPLPTVTAPDKAPSYGGCQMLLPRKTDQELGCGVIASANVLSYLTRFHGNHDGLFERIIHLDPMPLEKFNEVCMRMARGLLRPIPRIGLTGFGIAIGLNAIFRRRRMPYRAKWCTGKKHLWERIEQMLEKDLPVIFAVGPNWPIWKKVNLKFYRRRADGTYYSSLSMRAHFITATAMDESWLRVSSWGEEFYINRAEYEDYIDNHSSPLFTNVVLIQEKN